MNTTATQKRLLLSKHGMKELKKSITRLEHERFIAINNLRELDKNTRHDERLERIEKLANLDLIESQLLEKQQTLKMAKPLPTRRARMRVAIGSVVDLIDQQGRLFRYTLVDSFEANPSEGYISIKSPLGQSLTGKTVRDIVQWRATIGSRELQLVRIM